MAELDTRIQRLIESDPFSSEEFEALAKDLFTYQFLRVPAYQSFCRTRGITPERIHSAGKIPALPTTAFKHHRIASFRHSDTVAVFETTGTTKGERGRHEFDTLALYEASCRSSFRKLPSNLPGSTLCLSLVPSPAEAPHSSLAHMVASLARDFFHGEAIYAIRNGSMQTQRTVEILQAAVEKDQPVFLAATTAALVDLLSWMETHHQHLELPRGSALFETGGRKGRRYIPPSENLAAQTKHLLSLPTECFFGEYGMTEISSPAWGRLQKNRMVYRPSPWAPVEIVDPKTQKEVQIGDEGMVRILDLANRGSVSALLTGDWGRRHREGFEVFGRISDRELRGCSLAVRPPPVAEPADPLRLETIKAARQGLLHQSPPPFADRLDALSKLTEHWLHSNTKERETFEASLRTDAHPCPGALTAGLDRTFSALTQEKLQAATKNRKRIRRSRSHKGVCVQISAGNLPVTGVFDFYAGLLAGVPTLHRPSQRGGNLIARLQSTLKEIAPDVAAGMDVISSPSHDLRSTNALFLDASAVFAQGNDSTVEKLHARAPKRTPFYAYRSRVSFAVASAADTWDMLESLCQDIFIWEQQGCLSPQVVFVQSGSRKDVEAFAISLCGAAKKVGERWKRVPSSHHEAQRFWQEMEHRLLHPQLRFFSNRQLSVLVVDDIVPRWFSTPGLVQLCPIEKPDVLPTKLRTFGDRLSSMAISPSLSRNEWEPVLSRTLQLNRIVSFGELQSPTFDWAQDGIDRFSVLSRL